MSESCFFCGEIEPIEEHHIVPRRYEGSDDPENLVSVCRNCHKKLEDLYDKRFYDEIGVEKTTPEVDGICDNENCMAPAEVKIESRGFYTRVCESHAECDKDGCDRDAIGVAPDVLADRIVKCCDKHKKCQETGCESSDVVYARPEESFGDVIYCIPHAAEEIEGFNGVIRNE